MIRPIFDRLPGPAWLKVIGGLAVTAVAVWALAEFAFPAFDVAFFPQEEIAVVE